MGRIQLEIVTADPEGLLTKLNECKITLFNISVIRPLTLNLTASSGDKLRILHLLNRFGATWKLTQEKGFYKWLCGLFRRPVLLFGLALLVFLTLFLPSRILFVQVEGNENVKDLQIIEQANTLGLNFFSSRSRVRSEKIKNHLLSCFPELTWVGVNTNGSVAVIRVREGENHSKEKSATGVTSIVALHDGIVESITVSQGTPLCQPGQAVRAGQVLISGYSDLGLVIKGTQAKGEVYAQTQRELQIKTLIKGQQRGRELSREERYAIIIGNNRINFYKDSGIIPASCARICEYIPLQAPGGFIFPVQLVKEIWIYYEEADEVSAQVPAMLWLSGAAKELVKNKMIAGQILNCQESIDFIDDVCYYSARYICNEMIGQVKKEELKNIHG